MMQSVFGFGGSLTCNQIRQGTLRDELHPIPGDAAYHEAGEALVITVNVLVQPLRPPHVGPFAVHRSGVLTGVEVLVEVPSVQLADVLHQRVSVPLGPDEVLNFEFSYVGAVTRLRIGRCEKFETWKTAST